jgi:hypothetical protein
MSFIRGDPKRSLVLECPDRIANTEPVRWSYRQVGLLTQFGRVLASSKDERPLQKFFEDNPIALLLGLVQPHRAWVIPRPSLPKPSGGGWIPDFIVCEWSSIGPLWIVVELESPRTRAITKRGLSQVCNHGAEQINSYRTYLRDHAMLLRDAGWPRIHGECDGALIIARRSDPMRSKHSEKLEAFRRQKIEIMSYDRLLENYEFNQEAQSPTPR